MKTYQKTALALALTLLLASCDKQQTSGSASIDKDAELAGLRQQVIELRQQLDKMQPKATDGPRVAGKYKGAFKFMGPSDAYPSKAELRPNGNLYCESNPPYPGYSPIIQAGTYEVDGERVIFKINGQSLLWSLEGERLTMPDGSYLQKE